MLGKVSVRIKNNYFQGSSYFSFIKHPRKDALTRAFQGRSADVDPDMDISLLAGAPPQIVRTLENDALGTRSEGKSHDRGQGKDQLKTKKR